MVLNQKKIDKKYDGINLYKNNTRILLLRKGEGSSLANLSWKSYDVVSWSKYQIKETDMRQKTATFTSNVNLDLTTGVYCILISSSVHENFSGIIIKKTYNEDTGLYDYQCQDWSRQYQGKFELITNEMTVYRILQYMISRSGLGTGKISKSLRNRYKSYLSGLLPAKLYDPKLWGNDKTSNPMTVKKKVIIRDTSWIDAIRDLVYGSGAYIDIYFNDSGVLQIKPFNKEDWLSGGLVLATPEFIKREFSFDTTNILTNVNVNGSGDKVGKAYSIAELSNGLDLSVFFGNLTGSVSVNSTNNTSNNSSNTSKTVKTVKTSSVNSNKKEGTGIHVFMNTDTINGYSSDKRMMNDIANRLRKRGYKVTVGGVGPSTHYDDIYKVKKNGIYFTLYGGRCAGTLKEQCYSSHFHSVLKKRNARMVVGFYQAPLKDGWLVRAHDDNFSPSGFSGWNNPKSNLLNNGIGVVNGNSAKEIASNFPGFKKNNPADKLKKTTTTTKKVTTTKNDNTNYFLELNLAKNKALEEMNKSIRDLMTLKFTLPLGNPMLKNLHTNMFLWTILPEEFQVANFKDISTTLNSTYSRFSGYEVNRWYVEAVTISNNGKDASVEVTVNPFASTVSNYRDNRIKFETDYANAKQNKNTNTTNRTTSNNNTNKSTATKIRTPSWLSKSDKEFLRKIVIKAIGNKTDTLSQANACLKSFNSSHVYDLYYDFSHGKNFKSTWNDRSLNCGDGALCMCYLLYCLGLNPKMKLGSASAIGESYGHYWGVVTIKGKTYYFDHANGNGMPGRAKLSTTSTSYGHNPKAGSYVSWH